MAVDSLAAVVPPKDERAGIAWVVQDPQHLTMPESGPHQFSPLRAAMNSPRKQQPLLAKQLYGCGRRPGTPECVEQQPESLLDLFIGVQHQHAFRAVYESDRRLDDQFTAPRLVEDSAPDRRLQP